jgi:competence protein ComGC
MGTRDKTGKLSRASTLIELLAVIAVISFLAPLLLPSLKVAGEASYSPVCMTPLLHTECHQRVTG